MRVFLYRLPRNLVACFSGPFILAQLSAVLLTYAAVATGFDWRWYEATKGVPRTLAFPGILLGGLLPLVAPFLLLAFAEFRKDERVRSAAGALGQSAFLGWLVSSFYKSLTGRAHPEFGTLLTHDISHDFRFGFLRGGIFWGWPSSHATVAFATATAVAVMYGRNGYVKFPALAYALYVGLAVSVSIHWFSDFLAGAIVGSVIGIVVGRSFRKRIQHP